MKIYTLKRRQYLPHPIQEVFPFFQNPENLSRLTPDNLEFNIMTPRPILMRAGAVIDYSIKIGCMPVHWTTIITEYDPPYRFVDVQLKGPYAFWHHIHFFEKDEKGGTWMNDEVHYAMPFGIIGQCVRTLFVKRQLDRIFDFRAHVVAGFLGEGRSAIEKEDT